MAKRTLAPQTTSPAKMGEEMAHPRANSSQSPRLQNVPRSGAKSDDPVGTLNGVKPHHQERLGAQYAPQMTMSAPQAPEASQTRRNVRVIPSAVGNRDFYLKRQYGQNAQ